MTLSRNLQPWFGNLREKNETCKELKEGKENNSDNAAKYEAVFI